MWLRLISKSTVPYPTHSLRPYAAADEDAAIELWRRTWQQTYPDIDFAARVGWWRERWRSELVPQASIVVATRDGALVGFVTVDAKTLYLDQIVVAPEAWSSGMGSILIAEAKQLSPQGLDLHVNQDHARAIRFYQRQGFVVARPDANAISGRPTYLMSWRP
jgi:putative acetyltransferase